jgi:hypothetical protein
LPFYASLGLTAAPYKGRGYLSRTSLYPPVLRVVKEARKVAALINSH